MFRHRLIIGLETVVHIPRTQANFHKHMSSLKKESGKAQNTLSSFYYYFQEVIEVINLLE